MNTRCISLEADMFDELVKSFSITTLQLGRGQRFPFPITTSVMYVWKNLDCLGQTIRKQTFQESSSVAKLEGG